METRQIVKTLAAVGAGALAGTAGAAAVLYHNQLRSVLSLKKLYQENPAHRDGAIYSIRIYGDYGFDRYLVQGGSATDEELNRFVEGHLTKGLFRLNIRTKAVAGCSSFTARNLKGERLYARNYDLRESATCIVYTDPGHGRHRAISTADLKFLGIGAKGPTRLADRIKCAAAPYIALDGMNDAGVACAIHMSHQRGYTHQKTGKPGLNATTLVRLILDYADDVDHAVELAKQYDYRDSGKTSFHVIVADKSGKSAVLEWVKGKNGTDLTGAGRKLVVTYNEKNYQYLTNFVIVPDYYQPGEKKEGFDRYQIIEEKLDKSEGVLIDEQEAMEVLKSVAKRHLYGDGEKITLYSIVYNLTNLTAVWIGNEHYQHDDRVVKLAI